MSGPGDFPNSDAEHLLQYALQRAVEERHRSEAIIAAIGDGISIQDTSFKVLYQNQKHKDLIGDHLGEYCYAAYERKDAVCEECPVALSFQDGRVHTVIRTAETPKGTIHVEITSSPLRDANGTIVAGIEVARDITGRVRMEQDREKLLADLRILVDTIGQSQREWRDTFDHIQDPIYITDAGQTIIKANQAFIEFTGTNFQAVLGRKCYELLHKTGSRPMDCPHASMQASGMPADVTIVDDQRKRTLVITHFPYADDSGQFAGTISVIRDITHERENELRSIMNERLASLGQMASSIAHEINNPLAAMLGCAEALGRRVKQGKYDAALFEKYLKIIEEEVGRCKKITSGMLAISRKATSEKGTVDINAVLQKALNLVGYQGRLKEVEVAADFSAGLPAAFGSEGELTQVFLAVIANALDAMADRGRLTVATGQRESTLAISISDTGPGIRPEHLHRVFDPFFSTKTESGGTGLGLSIARKILANHHGDIAVASEPGAGTTFTITLPQE